MTSMYAQGADIKDILSPILEPPSFCEVDRTPYRIWGPSGAAHPQSLSVRSVHIKYPCRRSVSIFSFSSS